MYKFSASAPLPLLNKILNHSESWSVVFNTQRDVKLHCCAVKWQCRIVATSFEGIHNLVMRPFSCDQCASGSNFETDNDNEIDKTCHLYIHNLG